MTPVNFEATPFLGMTGSPSVYPSVMPPHVFWDPLLGTWQPYSEETCPPTNPTVLTPLSESSSSVLNKVYIFHSYFTASLMYMYTVTLNVTDEQEIIIINFN